MNYQQLFDSVEAELIRQNEKWGSNRDIPSVYNGNEDNAAWFHMFGDSNWYKEITDRRFREGNGSWADILLEEVAEALDADDTDGTRISELIQVAAVAIQWAQALS